MLLVQTRRTHVLKPYKWNEPVFSGAQYYVNDGFRPNFEHYMGTLDYHVDTIVNALIVGALGEVVRKMIEVANNELLDFYAINNPHLRH
jgi:hypothetical protein